MTLLQVKCHDAVSDPGRHSHVLFLLPAQARKLPHGGLRAVATDLTDFGVAWGVSFLAHWLTG